MREIHTLACIYVHASSNRLLACIVRGVYARDTYDCMHICTRSSKRVSACVVRGVYEYKYGSWEEESERGAM
jgi:hypothetical protein